MYSNINSRLGYVMGIGTNDLRLLLRLRTLGYIPRAASVVEIGAQQIENHVLLDQRIFEDLRAEFGSSKILNWSVPQSISHTPQNGPLSREMWVGLGCSYNAIDIDNSPHSIMLDLNHDSVPAASLNAFDLVTNYGTTEHVANQLNAFKIIHDLTKPGGLMVHHVPAQGHLNHGLFNYNAKFFWMLCRSNGYKVIYMGFEGCPDDRQGAPRDITDFMQGFESFGADVAKMTFSEVALNVALQKPFAYDYVSALDVPTGTVPASEELRKRYWTVFSRGVF